MGTSLCLIVKDEENNLTQCINSFDGLFDKIIIVDTGSSDKTVKIAKSLNASVFSHKWKNDFSTARNFALSKVESKWSLFVDADDRIRKEDKPKLKKQFNKFKKNADAILCPYICSGNINNQYGQTGYRARFIRTSCNMKYLYPVHEYLNFVGYKQVKINIPFYHVKKNKNVLKGLGRNIEIMKQYYKKYPKDLRMLYYLAHDNFYSGNFEESVYWSNKYINSKPDNKYMLNKVLSRQGLAFLHLKKPEKAMESFIMAIVATPLSIEPYLYLGDLNAEGNNYKEAIHFYKIAKSCKLPKNTNVFFNSAAYKYYADQRLSYTYLKMADYKKALKHALRAKKYLPNDIEYNEYIKKVKNIINNV